MVANSYADDYPKPGDADEDWYSVEEGCVHGVPWDEVCEECVADIADDL